VVQFEKSVAVELPVIISWVEVVAEVVVAEVALQALGAGFCP
jgi:hypothetical protein